MWPEMLYLPIRGQSRIARLHDISPSRTHARTRLRPLSVSFRPVSRRLARTFHSRRIPDTRTDVHIPASRLERKRFRIGRNELPGLHPAMRSLPIPSVLVRPGS